MTAQELVEQLASLDQAEKVEVLGQLAIDLTHTWPGIEKTPGVQGGDACIMRTRIPVWTLESYRRLGADDKELLANFPTLRPADLVYAWLYVSGNRQEIDQAIREQEET